MLSLERVPEDKSYKHFPQTNIHVLPTLTSGILEYVACNEIDVT